MVFEQGSVCIMLAGRDRGKRCVVIDSPKERHVLVDGATRRRVVNIAHLLPTGERLEIARGAHHDDVARALEKIGVAAKKQRT